MNIYENLQTLTNGLLFIGESEFPFQVIHLPNTTTIESFIETDSKEKIINAFVDANDFFKRYIERLTSSDDEIMMADIPKYQALDKFLKTEFIEVKLYKVGKIKVAIYIVCKHLNQDMYILKTYAIET